MTALAKKTKKFITEYEKRSTEWYETKNQIWEDYLIISESELLSRLAKITQIITFPDGIITTRFTHTHYVLWLVQTIAEELDLSVKVAMTIALAHDIGHLPFGHDGEKKVKEYLQDQTFNHGKNAVRIAKVLGSELHPIVAFGVSHHSDGDIWINKDVDVTEEDGWRLASILVAICDDIACFSDLRDIILATAKVPALKKMRIKARILMQKVLRLVGANDDLNDLEAAHRDILKGYAENIIVNSRGKNGIYLSKELLKLFHQMKAFVYKEFHQSSFIINLREESIGWLGVVIDEVEKIMMTEDYSYSQISEKVKAFIAKANYNEEPSTLKQKVVDFITTCNDEEIKNYYNEIIA